MPSVGAGLQELLLRPRWAWHRWRGQREHAFQARSRRHQRRMAEYEARAVPLEDALFAATSASHGSIRELVRAAPPPPTAPHQAIPPWHDGTAELATLVHALVRLRRPRSVVETGVARGVTSAAILDALRGNAHGHLWSLDLPGLGKGYREQVGASVPAELRDRWTLAFGPSAVALPRLLAQARPVDLFVHDSAHTYGNMRFEFEKAARSLAPDGLIVSDDVCNDSLIEFAEGHGWELVTVRQSKPPPWTYIGLAWPRRATRAPPA